MKFTVKSLVSSVNSAPLAESEGTEKEITITNPKATVQNLRAAAAVQFRLNVYGFSLTYRGSKSNINLTDEKMPLVDCGLSDGDHLILISKRDRADNGAEAAPAAAAGEPSTKVARTEDEGSALDAEDPIVEEALDSQGSVSIGGDDDSENPFEEEGEFDEEELNDGGELFGRLLEFGNLIELRQDFLTNPQSVMERIQRADPTLFQLITSNQDSFLELINNESLIRTIQLEKDAEGEDFDDEEMDEERVEAMNEMLLNLLGGQAAAAGEDGEGMGMPAMDDLEEGQTVPDKDRILAFVPSEEDEKKIQDLVLLGFSYEQCKLAFYMNRRSIERAANALFEQPPQL